MEAKKSCFIITPLGDEFSPTRQKAEGVIEKVIEPTLSDEYELILPHKIALTGNITKQIIAAITSADLVIANLTELNPNVMYELGIRMAFGKATIIIAEKDTPLPFDIAQERTIFYADALYGSDDFIEELQAKVRAIDTNVENQGPVYESIGQAVRLKKIEQQEREKPDGDISSFRYLIEKLEHIEQKLLQLSQSQADFENWTLGNRGYNYSLLPIETTISDTEFDNSILAFEQGLNSAIITSSYAILSIPQFKKIGTPRIDKNHNSLCQDITINIQFDADRNLPTILQFKSGLEDYAKSCMLEMQLNGTSR
jgi:hypothetical protein